MDKETALLQPQFHLQPAHLGTSLTEMGSVLQLMYQLFAYLDLKVMEQEVAFQLLLQVNYHLFVQVESYQMAKEYVFQIHQAKQHAPIDLHCPMEYVFGLQVKLSPHHQVHKIQVQLEKNLLSPHYQHAHQVSIQMDTETASLKMFQLSVHQDMKVM